MMMKNNNSWRGNPPIHIKLNKGDIYMKINEKINSMSIEELMKFRD